MLKNDAALEDAEVAVVEQGSKAAVSEDVYAPEDGAAVVVEEMFAREDVEAVGAECRTNPEDAEVVWEDAEVAVVEQAPVLEGAVEAAVGGGYFGRVGAEYDGCRTDGVDCTWVGLVAEAVSAKVNGSYCVAKFGKPSRWPIP